MSNHKSGIRKNGFLTAAMSLGLLTSSGFDQANAAGFEILKPHRAIYEIELKEATERSGIASMNGRIVYEMEGNECDGISVRYRFVSRVNANGDIFTTDQQTASFEAASGKEYSFITKSFVNEQMDRTVKGVAERDGDDLVVKLDSPEEREVALPNADFISSHLVQVIEKAREGVPFFKGRMVGVDGGVSVDSVVIIVWGEVNWGICYGLSLPCAAQMRVKARAETILATVSIWIGVNSAKVNLNAVATVDQSKTADKPKPSARRSFIVSLKNGEVMR